MTDSEPTVSDDELARWFRVLAEKLELLVLGDDGMNGVVQGMRVHVRRYNVPGSGLHCTRVVACPDHPQHAFAPPREERFLRCASRLALGEESVVDHEGLSDRFFARILPRSPYHVEIESADPVTLHRFERLLRATIAVAQAVWSEHAKWQDLAKELSALGLPAKAVLPYIFVDGQARQLRLERIGGETIDGAPGDAPRGTARDTVRIDALHADGARIDISPFLELPGVLPGLLSGVHLGGESHARFVTSHARAGAIRFAVVRLVELLGKPGLTYGD